MNQEGSGILSKLPQNYHAWHWLLVLLLVLTIPISQLISSRLIVVLLVLSLFRLRPLVAVSHAWSILLFIAVAALGLIYSANLHLGLGVLETYLSLMIFPLVIGVQPEIDDRHIHSALFTFVVGVCLGSLACLIHAFAQYVETGASSSFLYYELTGFLDFQPTYYAYFLVFSITISLYLLNNGKVPIRNGWMGAIIMFLFAMLLLTGGRTSFISMLLAFSFFVLRFFLGAKGNARRLTFGLVGLMIIGLFTTTALVGDTMTFSDSWDRYDLWKSALSANDHPILGVGTGDDKEVLNSYFVAHDLDRYASENLNAHNQFIQTYLSNGLLGLVSLVLLIGQPLYLGFRRDHSLTILIVFPFIIYGMTEVFLGRYQGVVFFALIHQLFVSHLVTLSKPTYTVKVV